MIPSWEEVKYQRDPNNAKKVLYGNRKEFYNREGNWKIVDSSKRVICKGRTKDMGMMISHLVHRYNSNVTYRDLDRSKVNHIFFQETITTPIAKGVNNG